MSTEIPAASRNGRFRKDLDREAVDLALKGEWDRAVEVNRVILELFADDVEAMNRLAKALIELGSYEEAGGVLDRVCTIAPLQQHCSQEPRARRADEGQQRRRHQAGTEARRSTPALHR